MVNGQPLIILSLVIVWIIQSLNTIVTLFEDVF